MSILGHGEDGSGSFSFSQPALSITSSTVGGWFERLIVEGGAIPIKYLGADSTFYYVGTQAPYGSASWYFGGTAWLIHAQADWQGPVPSLPTVPFAAPIARANTTSYATGAIVSLSGYYIQATVGGTSGGSPPSLKFYGQNITDGSVTWQLHSPVGACAIIVDSNATELRGKFVDMTSQTDFGLCVNNSLASNPPGATHFDHSVIGTEMKNAVNVSAGSNFRYEQSDVGQCTTNNCATMLFGGTSTGQVWINDNNFIGGGGADYGINYNAGSTNNLFIAHNQFGATGQSNVAITNIVSNFHVVDNIFNGNFGVSVSGTTHDFYSIIGNVCPSISTCVSDGAATTAVHRNVFGNNGGGPGNSAALTIGGGNPTGTTSTTGVMMGLGSTFHLTPAYAPRIKVTIYGQISNTTNGDAAVARIYYGTGTAPTNGVAPTGTNSGFQQSVANNASNGGQFFPFSLSAIITGLTPGTAYWFDLDMIAISGGTASVQNVTAVLEEM
jgi:hypothetical protein